MTVSQSKLIIPGVFGNILEWYDFSLYGYFAPILATLFFPTHSKFLSLLATFGIFAIGFLMRPLGAVIFGHYGDRVGRKKTLATAVILMAIPTTLIGLLPTYAQVGVLAGILCSGNLVMSSLGNLEMSSFDLKLGSLKRPFNYEAKSNEKRAIQHDSKRSRTHQYYRTSDSQADQAR